MTNDLERARAAYDAFGRGDVEALSELFDDQVEWVEPPDLPGARTYRGRSRVVEYLSSILRVWEEFSVEPQRFDETEDGIDVSILIRAIARQSGVSVQDRVLHRVTMRDGVATRIEVAQP